MIITIIIISVHQPRHPISSLRFILYYQFDSSLPLVTLVSSLLVCSSIRFLSIYFIRLPLRHRALCVLTLSGIILVLVPTASRFIPGISGILAGQAPITSFFFLSSILLTAMSENEVYPASGAVLPNNNDSLNSSKAPEDIDSNSSEKITGQYFNWISF